MGKIKCSFNCNEIKKLKRAIEVLKEENELLKKDQLLKDYNVYNRHYLDEILNEEYIPKLQYRNGWFYNFVLIDLDNLHDVNRKQGYEAGDEFIKNTIKTIKKEMKRNNVSGRIFRIGGDEFIIIYQPYDHIDFSLIPNITFAHEIFSKDTPFKEIIKQADAKIIEYKSKK